MGYVLNDISYYHIIDYITGNESRMCNAFGNWTGLTPQCKPIACGDPITFKYASVALLNGSTVWNSIAQYACISGYLQKTGTSDYK